MSDLHVYTASKHEWVIAESPADAVEVFCTQMGFKPDSSDGEGVGADDWEPLSDEFVLKVAEECSEAHDIVDEDADYPVKATVCPKGCDEKFIIHHAKTCAEWVRDHGRGYVASADC